MADFSPFLYLILPLQKVRSNTVRTEIKTGETGVSPLGGGAGRVICMYRFLFVHNHRRGAVRPAFLLIGGCCFWLCDKSG